MVVSVGKLEMESFQNQPTHLGILQVELIMLMELGMLM